MRIDLPALISSLLVKHAIIKGVALVFDVFQILPFDVACWSILAGALLVGKTSQAIDIGVAEQLRPDTVYMSCSLVTFNDNMCA